MVLSSEPFFEAGESLQHELVLVVPLRATTRFRPLVRIDVNSVSTRVIEGEAMVYLLGIMGLGHMELLILLLVMILLFGSAKLPSLMRNMGRSATEFKKGLNEPAQATSVADEESAETNEDSGSDED